MDGINFITLTKYVAVLVAAMIIGNWIIAIFFEINFLGNR
jgi:hypothetical protein